MQNMIEYWVFLVVKAYLALYSHISLISEIVIRKNRQIDTFNIEVSEKKYKQLKRIANEKNTIFLRKLQQDLLLKEYQQVYHSQQFVIFEYVLKPLS